jgi:hypothetical protein
MVSLAVERKRRAETPTAEGLLTVFRAVVRNLPTPDDSLLDRLFALECMVRAGRKAMAVSQGLLAVRREAELYIEQDWEPDVPHVAVLGQALSVIDAFGEDPPGEWGPRIATTVDQLSQRNSRFGLTSSGPPIAAVIRGLVVVNLPIPSKILDAIEAYLEASSDPVSIADLAEALARHRSTRQLAKRAAAAVFVPTKQASGAIAQWWLAERWELSLKEPIAAKASDVEDARLVALSSANPEEAPLAAMLAEVIGRGMATLVVIDSNTLVRVRERSRLWSVVENYSWRVSFLALLAAVATAKCFILEVSG